MRDQAEAVLREDPVMAALLGRHDPYTERDRARSSGSVSRSSPSSSRRTAPPPSASLADDAVVERRTEIRASYAGVRRFTCQYMFQLLPIALDNAAFTVGLTAE